MNQNGFCQRLDQPNFGQKGGEKDEENQTLIQKDSEGDESEPSQADEEVNRPN
jgi:hypothetical protein